MSAPTVYRIPALSRACRLLQLVAEHQGEWSSSELARALKVPRTTCFRMLRTLVDEKFIEADGASYRLGPGLVRLGLSTLEGMPIRRLCVPILHELGRSLGETVHLAILCDDRSLLLEVADSAGDARIANRPGTAVRLHASSTGKVLLAHLDKDRREALLARIDLPAFTPRTLATRTALRSALREVATLGYAVDDGEYAERVRCVAVPVHGERGQVIAALGMTGSPDRLRLEDIPSVAARMSEAAQAITVQLCAEAA